METEFLDTTLKAFETPQSQAIFNQLYQLFEEGTHSDEYIDPATMNKHLSSVKSYLEDAKDYTRTQFRCFFAK